MIGVVGASARAAVMTLARAGHSCWAVDLFNDRDLKRLAPCARCPLEQFPHAIPALAAQFPPGPVMYTGGIENHPDVIAELSRTRELLGNHADSVKLIRDPEHLASRSRQRPEFLPAGETVPEPDAQARAWLIKSLRSSGGLGIRDAIPGETVPPGHYGQQYIDGPAMSAVYRDEELLGITEQLIGTPWLHAKRFHYSGTIAGTLAGRASDGLLPSLARPANIPPLRGYFGIDFILNHDTPYVLEINPRYTASVEAIEFAKHLHCTVGKAIYFAPHTFRFPGSGPWDADLAGIFDPWKLPTFADIPDLGEPMDAGSPVITFFATGANAEDCRRRLQSRASELDRLFAGTHP